MARETYMPNQNQKSSMKTRSQSSIQNLKKPKLFRIVRMLNNNLQKLMQNLNLVKRRKKLSNYCLGMKNLKKSMMKIRAKLNFMMRMVAYNLVMNKRNQRSNNFKNLYQESDAKIVCSQKDNNYKFKTSSLRMLKEHKGINRYIVLQGLQKNFLVANRKISYQFINLNCKIDDE